MKYAFSGKQHLGGLSRRALPNNTESLATPATFELSPDFGRPLLPDRVSNSTPYTAQAVLGWGFVPLQSLESDAPHPPLRPNTQSLGQHRTSVWHTCQCIMHPFVWAVRLQHSHMWKEGGKSCVCRPRLQILEFPVSAPALFKDPLEAAPPSRAIVQ